MRLTESQERAVKSSKHLSVTASAGSGKTTVLIEKYIKTLEELINSVPAPTDDFSDIVESIVVITFTEKAGSELRKRATEAIEKRIKEAMDANDIDELRKFEKLRDAMPSAVIGTIHSFCASNFPPRPVKNLNIRTPKSIYTLFIISNHKKFYLF